MREEFRPPGPQTPDGRTQTIEIPVVSAAKPTRVSAAVGQRGLLPGGQPGG